MDTSCHAETNNNKGFCPPATNVAMCISGVITQKWQHELNSTLDIVQQNVKCGKLLKRSTVQKQERVAETWHFLVAFMFK